MIEQLELSALPSVPPKAKPAAHTFEYKITALRETAPAIILCDSAQIAADYWREHIATGPHFNPEVEQLYILLLNTRLRIKGHVLVSSGSIDTIMVHAREVFRPAIVASCAQIILMHNHPSGEPSPSEADIKVTRDLIRAGELLKIDVKDHVIMGRQSAISPLGHCSLREMGYFYAS